MKQLVMEYYGAQWEHVAKLCTCMSDDSKLSYLALAYAYMANHSAGGATGDNYVRLIELVAFLGSPVQRVCIKLTAGLFQRHMNSAKFYDGKSKIDSEARTISTRLVELTPHNRGVLQWVVSLDWEWSAAMPEEYEFLQKEKGRAVSLRLLDDEDVLEECIQDIMENATPDMLAMGTKYLYEPWMTVAWSLLHTTDPTLATTFAQGLLLALASNKGIVLSEQQKEQWQQPVEVPDAASEVPWTIDSPYFAYPGLSTAAHRDAIQQSFTLDLLQSEKNESVKGKVAGYGLVNPTVVSELQLLATGQLRTLLEGWRPGDAVATYWAQFKQLLPGLADTLAVNFGYVLATSTPAEQSFSVATHQVHPNHAISTVKNNLNFAFN
ncbi:hypothetical protein B484DRAFT_461099, partial [Ochromonadaceae sp. CCMP2298]